MKQRLRILAWHVHGSWLDAFVQGEHEYLLPTLPKGGPWGAGRLGRDWPNTREVPVSALADTDVDVVVLQRPEELDLCAEWLRRTPGRDLPAIYVEHNTPRGDVPDTRHPLADRQDIWLVHVTHFNDLMWDSGTSPTTVIEHGIVDPGELYTGELSRAAVVINEPVRRWRVTGTDLLPRFAEGAELDVFGMGVGELNRALHIGEHRLFAIGDMPGRRLHEAMARRRVYLHPVRWTSLGLSLIEAMHLGMPVVAVASTEAVRAVPPEAGVVSTDLDELTSALRALTGDMAMARQMGKHAREFALSHYGLGRFLRRWDDLLHHVAR
ncbi:MAG TPA: glycosyltransferase [Actinophytocola sp.]|uniref:glycosyltransferase n=1 Tax=Actinophytocola sp. TaxID=1872138 RepID=UPI002DDD04C4|nr:glycosyltransferase [Actinophytocola sp.]HEV2778902.1 glycosyltransferase [Actinophytocola sp.]